jgi:hypothetical protein
MRNDSTMKEKAEVLANDRRVREQTGTFMSHTHDDLDLGGRFAKQTPQTVIGASPVPQYPAGPAWSHDPTGIEPPFPLDVNQMQPCGEAHEIAASSARSGDAGIGSGELDGGAVAAPASGSSSSDAVETAAPPTFSDDPRRNK